MTIKVTKRHNKTINVGVLNKAPSGVISPQNQVTIKNVPTMLSGFSRLDTLEDVVASGETQGATLVYNSETDKYIVQKLNLSDVTGDLDGGTF